MAGSIGYGIWIDRESSAFEMTVDYSIEPYVDPETGETFSETSWTVGYGGGGTGGWGWDSQTVQLYLGFPPGEEVSDSFLSFSAMNTFSGVSVSMTWRVINAGLATEAKTLIGGETLDIIVGGGGDDLLRGFGGIDYLDAGAGADTLEGGDGADQLHGGAGRDSLVGGNGDDYYWVDLGADAIVETSTGGHDSVMANSNYTLSAYVEALYLDYGALSGNGNEQDNHMEGNLRDNALNGRGGDDQIHGHNGDDTLRGGDGNDHLDGGAGNNRLVGGQGDDHFVITSASDLVVERQMQGIDEIRVFGPAAYTLKANLELLTNISEIAVFHGTGNNLANVLTGSWLVDILDGGRGDDVLDGGMGNDVLIGGVGADQLVGGAGTDAAGYGTAATAVTVDLAAGQGTRGDAAGDSFESIEGLIGSAFGDVLSGDGRANYLEGGAGGDRLRGGDGDDTISGGAGADFLNGGAGDDWVSYATSVGRVRVDLQAQTASGGDAQGDTLIGFSGAEGSAANDALLGSTGNNVLVGGGGADILNGRAGNDLVRGGAGADALTGGTGSDTLDYTGSDAGVTVNLAALTASGGHADGDSFSGFERVNGSSEGDVLDGDALANMLDGGAGGDLLRGGAGNDTVIGGSGQDTMEGGDGIDTVSFAGSTDWVMVLLDHGMAFGVDGYGDTFTGIENIRGGEVSDSLHGNAGNNRIEGGAGGDFISGAAGVDVLYGGPGDDAFYFYLDSGIDKIMDFLPGGGWEDRISIDTGGYDTFEEVMALASMSGEDTVIDFGSGLQLIFVGVDMADLTTQDFVFQSY